MLKKPLNYEEQVEKLKEHGMSIEDDQQAIRLLRQMNYYRFTGYALQFRKGPNNSDYVEKTSFEAVEGIYKFDEELRNPHTGEEIKIPAKKTIKAKLSDKILD